ncbi:MAG: hypothetical protein NVS3B5_11140 [Sphingomicrobium sp.]
MTGIHHGNCFGDEVQQSLASWNRLRLTPGSPDEVLSCESDMLQIEAGMMRVLRGEVSETAACCPDRPEDFVLWFEQLKVTGPGQGHALFPLLADWASLGELCWFFEQEAAGEAGFDDLVALTQVRMPTRAKLELARNYWDEMGRGNEKGMHGPMLSLLARALGVEPRIDSTVWESLMLANAMTAMATRREYAWHSIGALGVIELTAPGRAVLVSKGLRRVGVSGKDRHYFDLHAVLDVKHSQAWNREVIASLVAEDPKRARYIAEGALIRLRCGELCFNRYAEALRVSDRVTGEQIVEAA